MAFIRTRARKTGPDAHQLQYDVAGKREAVTFTELAQAEHWCGIWTKNALKAPPNGDLRFLFNNSSVIKIQFASTF